MNGLKTAFLLTTMTAILAGFGWVLDRMLGTGGLMLTLFLGIGIVMNWVSFFYSDKIVLKMYKAKVVTAQEAPELYGMVARLCERSQLPMPKVCIIPTPVPNAFATGRNPKNSAVAVTEGLMQALDRSQLEGVIAHELGHIKNRDTLVSTVAASIASAIAMIANVGQMSMIFGGGGSDEEGGANPLVMLVLLIFAPIIAMMVQMAISRTREFGADKFAAVTTGNPDALAGALRRIEEYAKSYQMKATQGTQHMFIINPFSGKGMSDLMSTHPATEKRIAALARIKEDMIRGGTATGFQTA